MPNNPVTWLNEFTANLTTSNAQFDPDIIQLANGNILIAWTSDDQGGVGSPFGLDVIGQIFDPLGERIGGEFLVNQGASGLDESNVDFAAIPGGGFIAVYERADSGARSIVQSTYNAAGALINRFLVVQDSSTSDPNYQNPVVASSSATSTLFVYEEITGGVATLVGKIYNPVANTLGAQFTIMSGGATNGTRDPDVTVLTNGNYVITGNAAGTDGYLTYRIFDSAGGSVTAAALVASTFTNTRPDVEASVTALTGGGFVIAWTSGSTDSDIAYAVYNAAGTQLVTGITGSSGSLDVNNEPDVIGLASGGFAIVYDNDKTNQLVVDHFNAAGTILGTFTFAGPGTAISAIALADGRMAVTWSNAAGEISLEILDTRDVANGTPVYTPAGWQVGTIGGDTFIVAPIATITHGWDGADRIFGSSSADQLFGDNGDDSLYGAPGDDTLIGGAGSDFLFGQEDIDTAVFSFARSAATITRGASNSATITSGGETDTLNSIERAQFTDATVNIGKVHADFNGNGRDDILWRNDNGTVAAWLLDGSSLSSGGNIGQPGNDWQIRGSGDFNGDGKGDILWRNTDGTVAAWLLNGTAIASGGNIGQPGNDWKLVGSGDFDGDGKSDILWRNTNGTVAAWLLNGTSIASGGNIGAPGLDWHVVGTGDFNGDGKDDILWRNNDGTVAAWLLNGTTIASGGNIGQPGNDWKVADTGDFNGDGKDDILWRNDNGTVAAWFLNGTSILSGGNIGAPGNDWHIDAAADLNGDTKDDIIWRNDNGTVAAWLLDGTSIISGGNIGQPGNEWHVQNNHYDFL